MCYPDSLVGIDSHTHDGQRPGRSGLGRRRHRSRSRDARPADVFPRARRRRRASDRPVAAKASPPPISCSRIMQLLRAKESRRQVRRILRRGRSVAADPGSRHDRQHVARIRRDLRLLPGRRSVVRIPAHDGPRRRRACSSRPTTKRRACSACQRKATSITARWSSSTSPAIKPAVSGPRRPHDRLDLPDLKSKFDELMEQAIRRRRLRQSQRNETSACRRAKPGIDVGQGDVLISAITSCTNTSNPGVMLGAGLLAKKAVEKGLKPHPRVKTSLGPGSLAVTEYLKNAGLLTYLEQLGYYVAGYGCTTCIGNSGPLDRAHRRSGNQERSGRRGSAVGQSQLRSAYSSEHPRQLPDEPAAGGRVRSRRHGQHRHDEGRDRHRQGRQAGLSEGHLAVDRRKSPPS